MIPLPNRITADELSLILSISTETVKTLVTTKQLPCIRQKNRIYFDFAKVLDHFRRMETEGGAA